jgi:hypothetical protein
MKSKHKAKIEIKELLSIKKVISSSNLALRFYANDGWTKEELDEYCVIGEVHCRNPDDPSPYFTLNLDKGSFFDCVRLYNEKCGRLIRAFNDYPEQNDIQFMESHNS